MAELTKHDVRVGDIEDLLLQVLDGADCVNMVRVYHWHRLDGDQYLSVQIKIDHRVNRKLLGMKFAIDQIQLYSEMANKYMLQNENTLARWVDMFEGKYMFKWEVKHSDN
tara:strand:+ start:134 stop:463 length:330 start_codon:yes stop_codon:yes gene_type:complete